MRAIILAAGAGTRLQPLTDNRPKCLVTLAGKPLLNYQMEALHAVGVDDIVLVVGCKAEQVRAHCGQRARYIENADYLQTNSIYSLYLAAEELDDDTFLFNCDILFQPQVLKRMVDAPYPNVVAADGSVERIEGEMNICCDEAGCVTAISKRLDPRETQAQSVQLVKFSAAGARAVRQEVVRLVEENHRDAYPTSAYGPLIAERSLFAVEVGDLAWGEVDSLEDHRRATERVVPRMG